VDGEGAEIAYVAVDGFWKHVSVDHRKSIFVAIDVANCSQGMAVCEGNSTYGPHDGESAK
jgi:hypothetical protein